MAREACKPTRIELIKKKKKRNEKKAKGNPSGLEIHIQLFRKSDFLLEVESAELSAAAIHASLSQAKHHITVGSCFTVKSTIQRRAHDEVSRPHVNSGSSRRISIHIFYQFYVINKKNEKNKMNTYDY